MPLNLAAAGAAVLGAGAQIYDTFTGSKTARENTEKTIAAQKEMAELAYQRGIMQWHMQNAYNSPAAQMARYKAAGLNPHLIYGQGTPGNASSIPNYQAPDVQYKYQAPQYGAAVQTILPMVMQVGSWLQDMRLSEAEIRQKTTSTDKTQQAIDYLMQANPNLLKQLENKNELFPYQRGMVEAQQFRLMQQMRESDTDFRYRYGDDLFNEYQKTGVMPFDVRPLSGVGGLRGVELVKARAEARLKEAQASWTDFDITNPQALMQMALQTVAGMAGQTLRLSTHKPQTGPKAKRVKTFYQSGRRRSQVVDFE